MDDQSLAGAFSQFLPGQPAPAQTPSVEQDNLMVTSLKAAAGASGGPLAQAVDAFLNGEGDLHATTRAAVAKGGTSSIGDLAKMLAKQFGIKGPVAELIASLLVKVLPSVQAKEPAAKPKPRKEKPKTTASGKTAAGGKRKPKPKEAASAKKPKPKEAAAAKPKTKPKPKTTAKPKTTNKKPKAK